MLKTYMLTSKINALKGKEIIIIGAGEIGRQVKTCLECESISVASAFDNDMKKQGTVWQGIKVGPVSNKGDNYTYVIAINRYSERIKIRKQLISLGISDDSIVDISNDDAWNYWNSLPEYEYKNEISRLYFEVFQKEMNWDSPSTYNEIINYEKLYSEDIADKTRLSDKFLAREFVAKTIGSEYLVKYLGVWDKSEHIDFDSLPNSFVLKTNNGSGRNILVKNKAQINKSDICSDLDHWMQMDFGFQKLALHYKGIQPKIVCEEYLDGLAETVYDYDVFCFHGKAKYIWCIKGSHRTNPRASFYDTDWVKQEFYYGYPYDEDNAPRPEKLSQILELSEVLSKNFRHARVDWYIMPDGRVIFSEITFATWGGLKRLIPEKWDNIFGALVLEPGTDNS